jgi:hypothetical protein
MAVVKAADVDAFIARPDPARPVARCAIKQDEKKKKVKKDEINR